MVVISHFHGDHINGLLTADNTLAFPNAEVLVPAAEWKYFMDDGEMGSRPGPDAGRVRECPPRLRRGPEEEGDALRMGQGGRAGTACGRAIGHTPGHTSYVLSSGSDKVFIQSDVTNHPALFVANPGWQLIVRSGSGDGRNHPPQGL